MSQTTESEASAESLTLKEVGALLVKHFGHHDGLYDVALAINVAVGNIGPSADQALPGAMFGISGVGLVKANQVGPNTVDAAVVNPAKAARAKRKA